MNYVIVTETAKHHCEDFYKTYKEAKDDFNWLRENRNEDIQSIELIKAKTGDCLDFVSWE